MIAWKYIDKNAATIAAARDYQNMQAIIKNTPEIIKNLHENLAVARTANYSGLSPSSSSNLSEEMLIEQLETKDLINLRYNAALKYMAWFEPAWDMLRDKERHILHEFYVLGSLTAKARLADEFGYTERHIDRMRGEAVERLTLFLFG